MLQISDRLIRVAEQINKTDVIADIGTDHAYLPIYLLQQSKISRAYACDINNGPLAKAEENIIKYGLTSKIELRRGSGLTVIKPNEVDSIVVAGMGGDLMRKILEDSLEVVYSLKQLVLQPQSNIPTLRRYVHKIGLKIENEEMFIDEGKYYNVFSVIHGEESYTEKEYLFGKSLIEKKDKTLKQYIEKKIIKYKDLIKKLELENTTCSLEKNEVLSAELKLMEEVSKCL